MAIITTQEQYKQVEDSLQLLYTSVQNFLNKSYKEEIPAGANFSQQIQTLEKEQMQLNNLVSLINREYNQIINIIAQNILIQYQPEIDNLRRLHLIEETDTPREAAENIEKYIEQPNNRVLLESALKFLQTLMLPQETVEEIYRFETARILDDTMFEDEEFIETVGINGLYRVTYEISVNENGETERTEIKRIVLNYPVREVIRIGTKLRPDESENPDMPKEPTEPEHEEEITPPEDNPVEPTEP